MIAESRQSLGQLHAWSPFFFQSGLASRNFFFRQSRKKKFRHDGTLVKELFFIRSDKIPDWNFIIVCPRGWMPLLPLGAPTLSPSVPYCRDVGGFSRRPTPLHDKADGCILREIYFKLKGNDHSDCFHFDSEPIGIPLSSKSKEKQSPPSYSFQFETNFTFLKPSHFHLILRPFWHIYVIWF